MVSEFELIGLAHGDQLGGVVFNAALQRGSGVLLAQNAQIQGVGLGDPGDGVPLRFERDGGLAVLIPLGNHGVGPGALGGAAFLGSHGTGLGIVDKDFALSNIRVTNAVQGKGQRGFLVRVCGQNHGSGKIAGLPVFAHLDTGNIDVADTHALSALRIGVTGDDVIAGRACLSTLIGQRHTGQHSQHHDQCQNQCQ